MTVDEILQVAAFRDRDPEREAEVIAVVYHRLAGDIAVHLGPNVNWYGFATWSSKSVSEYLDLSPDSPFLAETSSRLRMPRKLRWCFRAVTIVLLGPSYQLGIALANRAIFLETGSLAAALHFDDPAAVHAPSFSYRLPDPAPPADDGEPDTEVRLRFITSLLAPADDGHLDLAAELLTEAAQVGDANKRAELILGANIALSAFEQARAQILLELVMYRPVRWLMRVSWRWLLSVVSRRPFHRMGLYTTPHRQMPWPVRIVESGWAWFNTRFLMTLRTPVSEIRLGRPLRAPAGSDPARAVAPIADARVRRLVARFQGADHVTGGVSNWLDYAARMRFITSYFRLYLPVGEMLNAPFAAPLLEELGREVERGTVPDPDYSEWFQKQQDAYEAESRRPGPRGWVRRNLYRPPIECDPDAAELAQIRLSDFLFERIVKRGWDNERPGTLDNG